jgi:hypothetical protein
MLRGTGGDERGDGEMNGHTAMLKTPEHPRATFRVVLPGRGGFALVQVLVVVAIAAVLGMAMLSGSALQVQQSANEGLAAEAEQLAESGVNLAMYYLQYPARAPALKNGYWPGGLELPLGGKSKGRADVTVTRDATDTQVYYVTSSGKAKGSGAGEQIVRTVKAELRVRPGLQVRHGLLSAVNLTLGLNVKVTAGNVIVDGALTNYGVILNVASARSFPVLGSILKILTLAPTAKVEVPRPETIERYETYVYADGRAYPREALASSSVAGATLGPSAGNPMGVYFAPGNLTLGDNVTINGTLVVEGDLILNGSGVKITAPAGQPALIVTGDIRTRSIKSMTVNGVTWVGRSIRGDGVTSLLTTLAFNGALMFGGSAGGTGAGAIDASAGTTVDIRFDPTRVNVPDMDRELARSVTVLRWGR